MDHYSILDESLPKTSASGAPPAAEPKGGLRTDSASAPLSRQQPAQTSVSTALASINCSAAAPTMGPVGPYPVGRTGHSMAEIAQRDLDAALQLLAERAQYITGASGAAIALRRGGHNDMLCCASSGSNAPELGTLLSAEFGLSGESVRTRLALRCDDAERDSRVNREGCRRLGIASVAVMPIVSDDEVLGVFELFSGKLNAFEERDLSALQRLGEMVETAVRLAQSAQTPPPQVTGEFVAEITHLSEIGVPEIVVEASPDIAASTLEAAIAKESGPPNSSKPPTTAEAVATAATKKPILWSAPSEFPGSSTPADQSHLPPVLRNLRKCQACGFPVSEGRALCVECEEKQWRGSLRTTTPTIRQRSVAAVAALSSSAASGAISSAVGAMPPDRPAQSTAPIHRVQDESSKIETTAPSAGSNGSKEPVRLPSSPDVSVSSEGALPLLSAGGSTSGSWFSSNKYVLAAILLVAIALAVISLLR